VNPRLVEDRGPSDPRLDAYRHRVARAYQWGEPVGFLATRVSVFWRVEGHLWWKRLVAPMERTEWELTFTDPDGANGPFQDRVASSTAQVEEMLLEWANGYVQVNGYFYTLEWLSGEEADAAPLATEYWD